MDKIKKHSMDFGKKGKGFKLYMSNISFITAKQGRHSNGFDKGVSAKNY